VEGAPAVVAELRVAENGQVSKGQLIAVLRGSERVEAGVREAGARVEAARKKVAQSREGPKTADVATREAEIGRLETELAHGRDELVRYQKLRQTDDVTESELAARRNTVAVAERALEESRQKLRSLNSTSTGAIEVAEAELKVAIAAEARVVADRAGTLVLAPAAGRVLKIHAHAGEQIGPDGLLELAKTARMYVVAEVHEGDARRVRAGQTASITGEMFAGELAGIVERIGSAIARSQLFPADPVAFADTRVVPVYIRLKDAGTAANLIHGKVSVVIRP
jgi:HlyD family secretion protein